LIPIFSNTLNSSTSSNSSTFMPQIQYINIQDLSSIHLGPNQRLNQLHYPTTILYSNILISTHDSSLNIAQGVPKILFEFSPSQPSIAAAETGDKFRNSPSVVTGEACPNSIWTNRASSELEDDERRRWRSTASYGEARRGCGRVTGATTQLNEDSSRGEEEKWRPTTDDQGESARETGRWRARRRG
jgi:hypothetical protein